MGMRDQNPLREALDIGISTPNRLWKIVVLMDIPYLSHEKQSVFRIPQAAARRVLTLTVLYRRLWFGALSCGSDFPH
jgi:hypothetical protein